MRLGGHTINLQTGQADGLQLSHRELLFLRYMNQHANTAVSRDDLLVEVWGYAPGVASRCVDTAVRRLRSKLEDDSSNPVHLLSVHGEGYLLRVIEEVSPSRPWVDAEAAVWGRLTRGESVQVRASPGGPLPDWLDRFRDATGVIPAGLSAPSTDTEGHWVNLPPLTKQQSVRVFQAVLAEAGVGDSESWGLDLDVCGGGWRWIRHWATTCARAGGPVPWQVALSSAFESDRTHRRGTLSAEARGLLDTIGSSSQGWPLGPLLEGDSGALAELVSDYWVTMDDTQVQLCAPWRHLSPPVPVDLAALLHRWTVRIRSGLDAEGRSAWLWAVPSVAALCAHGPSAPEPTLQLLRVSAALFWAVGQRAQHAALVEGVGDNLSPNGQCLKLHMQADFARSRAQYQEADRILDAALSIAVREALPQQQGWTRLLQGVVRHTVGELEVANEAYAAARPLLVGSERVKCLCYLSSGLFAVGRPEASLTAARAAVEQARGVGAHFQTYARAALVKVLVNQGRYWEAQSIFDDLLTGPNDDATVWHWSGMSRLDQGDFTGGLTDLSHAYEVATRVGETGVAVVILQTWGMAGWLSGDRTLARAKIERCGSLLSEMGLEKRVHRAGILLAVLAQERGDIAHAQSLLRNAETVADGLAVSEQMLVLTRAALAGQVLGEPDPHHVGLRLVRRCYQMSA